jgi:multidrug efflux pump
MSRFNLSEWGLRHPALILFFILASTVAGISAYFSLGRQEDPEFTIKTMVIQAFWPGATAREQELQVTDKLEKKLQELAYFDFIASYSKPGESTLKLNLRQDTPARAVPALWYEVRKKVADIQGNLPAGVQGPYFNDEFGDTFGTIYAFSADGFSMAEMKTILEGVRQRLLRVKDVNKVEMVGAQDERLYVEFSHRKLAAMGITPSQLFEALQRNNTMTASGIAETATDRIALRVTNTLDSVETVREVPIVVGGRTLRVGDVAEVKRGYVDPATFTMRVNGKQVIGLTISMQKGGNVLKLGEALDAEMVKVKRELPVGVEVEQTANQPQVVKNSIDEFMRALAEALAIVLAVSFLSLGLRTGIVVALSVPLVLAMTFLAMAVMGIDLHRISLGALIIALGLLVDDAIIAVEMMLVKMEQGYDRVKAASFAYTSTAFPMLTGTLVTAAGFVPVGFAKSAAGEYTNAIFWVVGLSLIISWIVAVLFTPYIGYKLLPTPKAEHHGHDPYNGRAYRVLRAMVEVCVRWRWTVIAATVLAFVASVGGFRFVQQQFFPSASRPELMIDLRLPEGSAFAATERAVKRVEAALAADADVAFFTAYTGGGTPRFYLPLNPELRLPNFAQFVVMTKGLEERERVLARTQNLIDEELDGLRGRVTRLENGPPVGFPVQFRVIGENPQKIRQIAEQVRDVMRANPNTRDVNLEWNELSKTIRLEIDRDRTRALGITPQDLAQSLNTLLAGQKVTQFRDGIELIDVVARAVPAERLDLDDITNVNVWTSTGQPVPLAQIARVRYELEEPVLWRRNRETMLTVRADILGNVQEIGRAHV